MIDVTCRGDNHFFNLIESKPTSQGQTKKPGPCFV
jgi:hypothetical protein